MLTTQNPLQICLIALKCIICLVTAEEKPMELSVALEIKENVSQIVVKFLLKGSTKLQDEYLYCKVS